jgi:hypothetical protein
VPLTVRDRRRLTRRVGRPDQHLLVQAVAYERWIALVPDGRLLARAALAAGKDGEMRLRKNQSCASELSEEASAGERRRRDGRGWGPFSGGQLTIIVVTLAVVIGFPVAANGVISGSNVFVTNSTTGKRAVVSSTGALSVGGSVTATEASPQSFIVGAADPTTAVGTDIFTPLATPPAGKAIVVTSVAVDTFQDDTPGSGEYIGIAISKTDATCGNVVANPPAGLNLADVNPGSVGATVMPFQPGVVVPAGRALCVQNTDESHLGAEVFAYGYLVPAASAPTGAVVIGGTARTHVQSRNVQP